MRKFRTESDSEKSLLEKIRYAIQRIDSRSDIILYGSRARGDATSESDYDLLILTDGPATLKREDTFRRELFPIELETGAVLTVNLMNRKNWNSKIYAEMPFHQNVQRDGVIL